MNGREEFDYDVMRRNEINYEKAQAGLRRLRTVEYACRQVRDRWTEGDEKAAELRQMPYAQYLATPHWQELRRKALERDHRRCRVCNKGGVTLDVHHTTYERRGEERLSDLVTLCRPCHEAQHQYHANHSGALSPINQ